jgi:hypothetical protein
MFRRLNADEIECRVQSNKDNGCILLLYKNARCDMNILDETVGQMNWQRDHKELKGVMYAGVGIYDTERGSWVWKWDCGSESNTDAQKGEASDSFKRACVNWGIGRELYTAPFIWINRNDYEVIDKTNKCKDSFRVGEIGYDDAGNISYLTIFNKRTDKKVYSYSTGKKETPIKGYPSRDVMVKCARDHYPGDLISVLLETFGIEKIEDATDAQLASVWNKYGK